MLYVIVSFGLFFKKEHVCTDLCCSRNRCNNQIPGVNKTVIIVKVYIDLMKKNHHQQNQQHLRLDEIFAFGSHVCFDLRFWFWMLDVHIIQQISVINCRIATVAYYKGMSSFFSNSHTVATRASAHFCCIFTAAPASHNSAPLVSPIHTIGSTNTDRVSKLYTGLTPLSLFSSVHLTNSLDQTRFAQMSSCGKMTPITILKRSEKGRGRCVMGEKIRTTHTSGFGHATTMVSGDMSKDNEPAYCHCVDT